jgi:hypothetical protein
VASPTPERADSAIPSRWCADWPDHRIRTSTRAANRTASAVVVRRHRVKDAAIESSFWIIPPRRSETAVLYGRSREARSAADSSPKRFASRELRFEEAGEDCGSCDDRSGSIVASSEMASVDRHGAQRISSVNSTTDVGDKGASEGKRPAPGTTGVYGSRVSDRGRMVAIRSLEDTFHDRAGKIEAVVVADAGCRGANPIAQLRDRIGAAFHRRLSVPPLSAAAQRSAPASQAGDKGRTSSNSASSGRRRRSTRDGRREEGRQS